MITFSGISSILDNMIFYYIADSACIVFWSATQAGKMGQSFPLGIACCDPTKGNEVQEWDFQIP